MSSYLIEVNNDTLQVKFNLKQPALGDQVVKDAAARLEELIASGELTGGQLLKIDGPTAVPVAYTLAHRLSHLYGAIAVCDPKLGDKGKKVYIVSISHNPDYHIGDLIVTDESQSQLQIIKLAFCGSSVSAKSELIQKLEEAIKCIDGAPYPKIYSPYPSLAEKLAREIKKTRESINLIDVAGTEQEAQIVVKAANHAVIVVEEEEEVLAWKAFCQSLAIPIVAIIRSDQRIIEDCIETQEPKFIKGVIHNLKSDEMVSESPLVKELAKLIVNLTLK